jgi:hypothetical protein
MMGTESCAPDSVESRLGANSDSRGQGPHGFRALAVEELEGRQEPVADMRFLFAPPAGFEPAHPPPEGGALSPELRGLRADKG